MATFLIALFSVILVLTCLFVTLLVLMQKPSANSGMGAALGGGAAEQAFGGEAGNVLTKGTIYAIIAFFVLSFALYLGTLATSERGEANAGGASIRNLESTVESAEAAAAEEILPDPATDEGAGPATGGAGVVEETESVGGQDASTGSEEPAGTLNLEDLDADSMQKNGGS